MHDVAFLVGAAAVAHLLARWLDAPAIPLLILAGAAAGRLAHFSDAFLGDAVVLGASFLLFTAGMDLSARRVRSQASMAVRVGSAQFLALAAVGFGAALFMGYTSLEGAYIAVALTASSTLVGIRVLKRRRQMFEPFGRLVLGVLLVQDLLVVLSVPLVLGFAAGGLAGWQSGAGVAVLTGLSLAVRRWGRVVLVRVEREGELVLLAALSILFAFTGFSVWAGIPVVVGAFLAGVALSSFPVDGVVRPHLTPIADFFGAVFFTALGALVVAPTLAQWGQALALSALVIGVTVPLVASLAVRSGLSVRPALDAGLLLSQTSEISLVLVLSGMLQGHIGEEVFTVVALVTVLTILLTPLLATGPVALRLAHLVPQRAPAPSEPPHDHVLVLGAGSTGSALLEDLILASCRLVVVEDDPLLAHRLRDAGIHVVRGDASDARVLERAGASGARLIISTLHHPHDVGPLLDHAVGVPVLVRVFDAPEASWVRSRGGEPVHFHEASARLLLDWVEEEREWIDGMMAARVGNPGGPGAPTRTATAPPM